MFAGGHRIRVTPVPIPNTEVKPDTADGTVRETAWESRSLPAVISKKPEAHEQVRLGLFRFPWRVRARLLALAPETPVAAAAWHAQHDAAR